MKHKADSITMQVIRYAMEQIADEMGHTLVRTARSTVIKEVVDISCAVFDSQGNTVAQAHHAPMLLTGFEIGMKSLRRRFRDEELDDGDLWPTTFAVLELTAAVEARIGALVSKAVGT